MPRQRNHSNRGYLQRVSIRAERKPEPDWDRFAWALLQYIRLKQAGITTTKLKPDPENDIVNLTTPDRKGA
jgi:hypothetical protein